jgi:hypothetical protein
MQHSIVLFEPEDGAEHDHDHPNVFLAAQGECRREYSIVFLGLLVGLADAGEHAVGGHAARRTGAVHLESRRLSMCQARLSLSPVDVYVDPHGSW